MFVFVPNPLFFSVFYLFYLSSIYFTAKGQIFSELPPKLVRFFDTHEISSVMHITEEVDTEDSNSKYLDYLRAGRFSWVVVDRLQSTKQPCEANKKQTKLMVERGQNWLHKAMDKDNYEAGKVELLEVYHFPGMKFCISSTFQNVFSLNRFFSHYAYYFICT